MAYPQDTLKTIAIAVGLHAVFTVTLPCVLWYVSRDAGWLFVPLGPVRWLGAALMVAGSYLYTAALARLLSRQTSALPGQLPTALETSGWYAYVRHPLLLGVVLILVGEAIVTQSLVLLGYAAVYWLWLDVFVARVEEPQLHATFGDDYASYCREVPRWLPSLARRKGVDPGAHMASSRPSTPLESGHAPVNGIRMYYEIHGRRSGVPLVLLHGGGSTIEVTFGRVLPVFARSRMVIAVEEQGHGRTTDRDQPVRFESSADDVAALLRHLAIQTADVFGFSNGASVALQVAIRHPERLRKLIFASSITTREGADPQLWEFIRQADFSNMPQPLKEAFLRVSPDTQQLKTMHDKDAERMRHFTDVPDDAVRSVRAPTLIVLGDRDIVKPEHAVELTRLISGARLLILPGGHGDYLGEAVATQSDNRIPELTAQLIEEFLDSP